MKRLFLLIAMVASASLVACGGNNDSPPPSKNPSDNKNPSSNNNNNNNNNNNGTCQNGQHRCSGLNLQVCKNGAWTTNTCDYVCQQSGLGTATGCGHDPNLGYESCRCAPPGNTGTCKHGERTCSGMNLQVCQNGTWTTATCDFLCQQSGLGSATSCGYDASKGTDTCYCDNPAPKCTEGAQKCSGNSLMQCKGGTWHTEPCAAICHAGGMGMAHSCTFDSSKGMDACLCYNGDIGDPCANNADCTKGTCNSKWCSMPCSADYQCGKNSLGHDNFCMATQGGGAACFPFCSSNSMCVNYPGTSCQKGVYTVDNKQIDGVCAQ